MLLVRIILIMMIVGIPLGAYVPRRTLTSVGLAFERWSDSSFPITWRLNATRGSNVAGSRDLAEIFRQAFQTWAGVSTARVSFLEGTPTTVANAAQDGINLVSVIPTVYNSDARSLTILYIVTNPSAGQFPGQILEADILFNPQALMSTDINVPSDRFDLQALALHEIGHLLGLDHSGVVSSAMFPSTAQGSALMRVLSQDDIIGFSNLYPAPNYFAARGSVQGTVRNLSGAPIFGAHVVLVDGTGKPVVSALTESDGGYFVRGLEPGNYSAFTEPLDQPLTGTAILTLGQAFPNQTPNTTFTTRFATTESQPSGLSLNKTGGRQSDGGWRAGAHPTTGSYRARWRWRSGSWDLGPFRGIQWGRRRCANSGGHRCSGQSAHDR